MHASYTHAIAMDIGFDIHREEWTHTVRNKPTSTCVAGPQTAPEALTIPQ